MRKIIIFGNSGSGKTSLAKRLCQLSSLAHLDLDMLAWEASNPPVRRATPKSQKSIQSFIDSNPAWVIEGCYSDLLSLVIDTTTEVVFLDLDISICIENAKARPWEPHKYPSKAAQDEKLPMLISWISEYETRRDTFSRSAHTSLFDAFAGRKSRLENLADIEALC